MTKDDIAKIDGFTPDLAQKVADLARQRGGFSNLDEMKQVPGMTDALIANLKKAGVVAQKAVNERR